MTHFAKRSLGQNFLRDPNYRRKIVEAALASFRDGDVFLEIGPGNVLKGLIRKIDPQLIVHTIQKPEDVEAL